jgi:hypothetical protein
MGQVWLLARFLANAYPQARDNDESVSTPRVKCSLIKALVYAGQGMSATKSTHIREEPMAEEYSGEAYCVKCKAKRDFTGEVSINAKGTRMAKGKCPVCDTTVTRILGKAKP